MRSIRKRGSIGVVLRVPQRGDGAPGRAAPSSCAAASAASRSRLRRGVRRCAGRAAAAAAPRSVSFTFGLDRDVGAVVLAELPARARSRAPPAARRAAARPGCTPTCAAGPRRGRPAGRRARAPRAPASGCASARPRNAGCSVGKLRRVRDRSLEHGRAEQLGELGRLGERVVRARARARRGSPGLRAASRRVGELRRAPRPRAACARRRASGAPSSSSASASSTSPGRQMNTGPVGGVSATFAARRRMRGRSSTRVTSTAHFTSGCAIGTSGVVEQRLEQAVALLLLAGGEDHRRAGELRVVERAHGVAEARRDVHVRRGEPARGARVAVGHADHDRLLQPEHELELREVGDDLHDRQLGGAGIAEQMRDALVDEEAQEGAAAGESRHAGQCVRTARSVKPCTEKRAGDLPALLLRTGIRAGRRSRVRAASGRCAPQPNSS